MGAADRPRFRVRFDDLTFNEDLRHATPAGREVARAARASLERDGVDPAELRRCVVEGPDGTSLPNCVKLYLPDLGGRWRMVLQAVHDPDSRRLLLAFRAFGVGHPEHPWQPSVYDVAHRRLHDQ